MQKDRDKADDEGDLPADQFLISHVPYKSAIAWRSRGCLHIFLRVNEIDQLNRFQLTVKIHTCSHCLTRTAMSTVAKESPRVVNQSAFTQTSPVVADSESRSTPADGTSSGARARCSATSSSRIAAEIRP